MIKVINLFLIAFSLNAHSIVVSNMTFEATRSCPAYQSKNKQTNPNNLAVEPNRTYTVRELNKASPDWFRIEMADMHELRWVSAECGTASRGEHDPNSCTNAGMADSYVLALSSQPGFCETYGYEAAKPECRKLSKNSYQAKHLTLHGLWPNQNICGQNYGFCEVNAQPNHCDYVPLSLSVGVGEQLKKLMPSYYYGSCLERHEWYKHGTCQILSADDYFTLAMRLVSEADQSPFGVFLTEHQGQKVQLNDLRQTIANSFGANNQTKIYLGCKNGILVDVFVQLPALIPVDKPLAELVSEAPDAYYKDLCPKLVTISNFSKEAWYY
jgi:ribonuclease T2